MVQLPDNSEDHGGVQSGVGERAKGIRGRFSERRIARGTRRLKRGPLALANGARVPLTYRTMNHETFIRRHATSPTKPPQRSIKVEGSGVGATAELELTSSKPISNP